MGCCQSSNSAFRFKNYVVAVYPEEEDGEANLDSLGKLKAYVSKNPERIPKVCRKVSKLMIIDLQKQRVKRVNIGASILHELIADTSHTGPGGGLDYFVPHTVEMVLLLHKEEEVEYRISACDLTAVLTHNIGDKLQYQASRRSLASCQTEFVDYLAKMAVTGLGTSEVFALHCRYAALVALGNLFRCLTTSLVDSVEHIATCTLENYVAEIKESRTAGGGARMNSTAAATNLLLNGTAASLEEQNTVLKTVVLPMEAHKKDAAYQTACLALLMTLATSCSNATAGRFVAHVCAFMDTNNAWGSEALVLTTFKAITLALHRKQQLGFSVCQKLLDLILERPDDATKLEPLLKAVAHILAVIPLNGMRPMLCMDAVSTVLRSPSQADVVYVAGVRVVEEVAKRTREQGNMGQLLRVGMELCHSVSHTQHNVSVCVGLDALGAAAPNLCKLSPLEKNKLKVPSTLRPFLYSDKKYEVSIKEKAITCLATYLLNGGSAVPTSAILEASVNIDDSIVSASGAGAAPVHTLPDELDFAHHWLRSFVLAEETLLSPLMLAESCNVVLGMLRGGGYALLPWVLDVLLFDLQVSLEKIESNKGGSSQWTLMWHLFALTTLRSIGQALNIRELVEYSTDILKRRRSSEAGEVPMSFQPKFEMTRGGSKGSTPSAGLQVAHGHEDSHFIKGKSESAPAATYLVNRKTVAQYLHQHGNMSALMDCYCVDSDAAVMECLLGNDEANNNTKSADGTPVTRSLMPLRLPSTGSMLATQSGTFNMGSPLKSMGAPQHSTGTPFGAGGLNILSVDLRGSPALPGESVETSGVGGSLQDLDLSEAASDLHFCPLQDFAEVHVDNSIKVVAPTSAAQFERKESSADAGFRGASLPEELKRRAQLDTVFGHVSQDEPIAPPSPVFKRATIDVSGSTASVERQTTNDSITTWNTLATTTMGTPGLPKNVSVTTSRAKVMRMPGTDLSPNLGPSGPTVGGGQTLPCHTSGQDQERDLDATIKSTQGNDSIFLNTTYNNESFANSAGANGVSPAVADFDLYA